MKHHLPFCKGNAARRAGTAPRPAGAGWLFLLLLCFSLLLGRAASAQVNVLMHHNNLGRTGVNYRETALTTSTVKSTTFGKVFTRDVDDQIYAQPLVLSNVAISGKGTRNIVVIATVNNSVYAFDADNPAETAPLWKKNFNGTNVVPPRNTDMTGACGGSYNDFSGNMGIVGTPAVDSAAHTMYVVVRTKENGTTFVQKLHALDLFDGSEKANSPVTITASVAGTGSGGVGGVITFDPQKQNQRAALTLVKGVVYIAWASHCDWGPYHGWVLGYDATTMKQVVVYNDTKNGDAGGIWMAGSGFAADAAGNLFATVGNGTVGYNGNPSDVSNRGESALKLTQTGATLGVSSWFTPYNHQALEDGDLDLGSSGPVLIPGTSLMAFGGKGGVLYVVNRDNMGGVSTNGTDNQIVQSFPVVAGRHIHGTPTFWKGSNGQFMYVWSEYDHLKAFKFDPAAGKFQVPAYAASTMAAPDGMPGAMLSVTSNGQAAGTGIVWASHPLSGDANQQVRPGILRAFDASDITKEIWNSDQNSARDGVGNFAKFNPPTVANGKVYLATFSNKLVVYGAISTPVVTNNVALNKPARANGYCAATETAAKAVDGTTAANSKWCYNVAGDKWLRVDLGGNYEVSRWVVKHAGSGGENWLWNTRDFSLQQSMDTVNWQTVDAVAGSVSDITDRNVAPFTARYVRLLVTNSGADNAARIYELEIHGNLSNNLALNKPTSANGYCTATETPNKAVDGTTANNSKWCYNVVGDKWLSVNLGQSYGVTRWVVKHAGAGGENAAWNTRDFSLQKSTDNVTWQAVDNVTGNTANITDRTIAAATAQYFRLYITNSGADAYARIYELELYGKPAVVAQAIPGKIEAESFSAQSGTQTETTTDTGGGLNVDYFETNDWLDYSVNVATAGSYTVGFRVASANGGATVQLRNSAGTVLGSVNVGNTGGWQSWQTINAPVTLPAGPQTLRVFAAASTGCNLNYLTFATATSGQQLEAELANVNNGMIAEACTDTGGGQDMGYVDAGDYLVWNTITFPTTGSYLIEYRVASGAAGGTISSDLNAGSILLGNTTIPGTGGWQTWTTVSNTVNITAGTYNFGIYAQTNGWNLNWVRITKTGARSALASTDAKTSSGGIILYPNPVGSQLTLAGAEAFVGGQIRILDMAGREIWLGHYQGPAIPVTSLKAGSYLLELRQGTSTSRIRFVKQ